MELRERIALARKQAGLSQEQLGGGGHEGRRPRPLSQLSVRHHRAGQFLPQVRL